MKSTLPKVLKAAVQPIWAWFWNGLDRLVPPALLYHYFFMTFVSNSTIWWINLKIFSKKNLKKKVKKWKVRCAKFDMLPFSQFGLDFETVWWTLFLLLFFISAILWPLSLKGLFDGLIWTLLQKNSLLMQCSAW